MLSSRPAIHALQFLEPPVGPGLIFQVPLGREPHTREVGDTGATLPTSPRNANSTSPQGEPVQIPLGEAGAHLLGPPGTCATTQRTNRAVNPRTPGRHTVLVPMVIACFRGWLYPFR